MMKCNHCERLFNTTHTTYDDSGDEWYEVSPCCGCDYDEVVGEPQPLKRLLFDIFSTDEDLKNIADKFNQMKHEEANTETDL